MDAQVFSCIIDVSNCFLRYVTTIVRFELDKERLVEFTQVAIKKAQTSEHVLNRVMPKDNIGLCAVFKIKDNVYANSLFLRMFLASVIVT